MYSTIKDAKNTNEVIHTIYYTWKDNGCGEKKNFHGLQKEAMINLFR